ncbi:MAG TPA: inorganic phosphate transporter [Verrucomicrobiae bacterium]|jgi:PiT family inorganic phosphate transporter|nr:inorganic phosphate transporter [Verrucomicrobiae bacterium]
MEPVFFLIAVILVILSFTLTNGFHDAANAIATVVGTRVLTPRQAVVMGAVTNFIGALSGVAVAKTIGGGLVDAHFITPMTILCAMFAGISWNLITWHFGLPSSSSHALIGGLLGAAYASSHNKWSSIYWAVTNIDAKTGRIVHEGVYYKVVVPMVTSPLIGFVGGMIMMGLLFAVIRSMRPRVVDRVFGKLQLASAAYMGWAHGFADGQKTMGIVALACFVATTEGALDHAPAWLGFLRTPQFEIKSWIEWTCGLAMACGTYLGGWRIIQTLGHNMVRLRPVHGFAAETTGATILLLTGRLGMSVSTTHVITTAIMGVGCARRFNALNWILVERIVWAWILTLPANALLGYTLVVCTRLATHSP